MAVIALVSPKGGVGKTTATALLASQIAQQKDVVVSDADPNRPIASWAKLPGKPERLRVISDQVNQDTIMDHIAEAAASVPFVLVDCEGSASLTVAYAIGAADLVIVPCGGSQLDAQQAARALALVKNQEKLARRTIVHAVLLTRTNPAIKPHTLSHIKKELLQHGVRVYETELNEREAFRSLFSFGGGLQSLEASQVSGLDKAIDNAQRFMAETIQMLRAAKTPEAAA